jgi:putative flippase GtrA
MTSAPMTSIDIVVPVYNEQDDLEPAIRRLHAFLLANLPYSSRITIADNASTDSTLAIADRLAAELPNVRSLHLRQKGRGRALHAAWSASDADVLAYMDVDLSTDLEALLPLVAPLLSGHSDLAIGTRLARSSRVRRGAKRELISRGYNLLLHATLGARFSDAQCGFKAIRADVAAQLLPLVQDTEWFFDTELLVLAQRRGMRIHEVPVDWVDDADSRVDILRTALADLRGIARLAWAAISAAQLLRFALVGVASTAAYVVLFALLRNGMTAQAANLIALLATAVGNTAANRRFTFGITTPEGRARQQLQGLFVFALALAVTSGSLELLHAIRPTPARTSELAVLVAANAAATALRFLLLRWWVFRPTHSRLTGSSHHRLNPDGEAVTAHERGTPPMTTREEGRRRVVLLTSGLALAGLAGSVTIAAAARAENQAGNQAANQTGTTSSSSTDNSSSDNSSSDNSSSDQSSTQSWPSLSGSNDTPHASSGGS